MGTTSQSRFNPSVAPELSNYTSPEAKEAAAKSKVETCHLDLKATLTVLDATASYASVAGEARSIFNDLLLLHKDLKNGGEAFPHTYQVEACREAGNKIKELVKKYKPSTGLLPSGIFQKKYKETNIFYQPILYLAVGVSVFVLIMGLLNKRSKKYKKNIKQLK